MIKRAPSVGQLAGMVIFALSCFSLVLFLWVSFGGPVPLKPQGYRIHASFDEAVQLATEGDVRISGVSVGKVKKITPSTGRTDAVLEIDARYAPLPNDVRAMLRIKTLLGETYVELTPGTKGKPTIPENGYLAVAQVDTMVELDEVIRTFDPATRAAFEDWMVGQADSMTRRGDDLNQAFGVLPMFFADANDLLSVMHRQDRALSRVFANVADIFEAFDENPGDLTRLIESSNRMLRITANRSEQLTETFNEFPEFLREIRATIKRFTEFTEKSKPLIDNTTVFAEELAPTLRKATKVTADARSLISNMEPLLDRADAGLPAADEFFTLARPTLGQLDAFLRQLNPVLEYIGLYKREITAFIANDASATQAQYTPSASRKSDYPGHYLRAFTTFSPDALANFGNRTDKSRSNAYPVPGWYDRLAQGLQVFDDAQCGTIAVPTLNTNETDYTNAGLDGLLDEVTQIVYDGDATGATLPAPVCDQQPAHSFGGESGEYPHVRERSTP